MPEINEFFNKTITDVNESLSHLVEEHEKARAAAERPGLKRVYANKEAEGSALADVPLTREAIPSLLTRAKLSPATRLMEERRLKSLKKKYLGKKARGKQVGRRHYKKKLANKKKRLRKIYERHAGFGAMLRSRGYKQIDPAMWDRYIGECFREYSPEYLEIKRIKRFPKKGDSAYYGTKMYPLTVYSYRVFHKLLGVVYDGNQQLAADMAAGLVREEDLIKKPAD